MAKGPIPLKERSWRLAQQRTNSICTLPSRSQGSAQVVNGIAGSGLVGLLDQGEIAVHLQCFIDLSIGGDTLDDRDVRTGALIIE